MRRTRASLSAALVVLMSLVGASRARGGDALVCANSAEHAQQLRRAGSLRAARDELVTCARATCPALVRKDCTAWLADLDLSMPTIVFRVEGAHGEEVTDATVKLDATAIATDGKPLAVDPGAHVVRVERGDQPALEVPLAVRAGEKDRVFVVHLPAPTPVRASTLPEVPSDAAPASRPLVGWVVGGVGAAALAVTASLWILGATEESHLRSTCGVTHSCMQSDVDASHGKLVAGDVIGLFGSAAVVAGGSLLLFYKPSTSTAVSIAPAPGGGAILATGRF